MKHAGIYLTIALLLVCFTTNAQKCDTLVINGTSITGKEAVFLTGGEINIKSDTLYIINNRADIKGQTISIKTDTLYLKGGKLYNKSSTFNRLNALDSLNKDKVYVVIAKDSSFKKFKREGQLFKSTDSFRVKSFHQFSLADSGKVSAKTYKTQVILKKQKDSVYMKTFAYTAADSGRNARRVYKIQMDSYQSGRTYDSAGKVIRAKDTARIKGQLKRLNSNLAKLKADAVVKNDNMRKQEVSIEVSCGRNGTVRIKNLSRKISLRTYNEDKVKIVSTIFAAPGFESKDVDWSKVLNVTIEETKAGVDIGPADVRTVTASSSTYNHLTLTYAGVAGVNGTGSQEAQSYRGGKKSELVIYIPVTAKLMIENRYNDVSINNDLVSIEASLMNANLKMKNAETAIIKSRYGTVNAGNIRNGDIELLNCKFISEDMDKLTINSRYSTVTFENSGVINITSISDQYRIAKVADGQVTKTFGKLNIDNLTNSFVMTGSSADLTISAIKATATRVDISNKYADIKLPLNQLKNYTLKAEGMYSNFYSDFEAAKTTASDSLKTVMATLSKAVGNTGKGAATLDVNCTSCTVDFR